VQNNSAALTKYHRGDLLVEIVEEKQLLLVHVSAWTTEGGAMTITPHPPLMFCFEVV
jgi:hypothetical protein